MDEQRKDKVLGKNKWFRKAIAHAIDVKQRIDLLSNGRGIKLYSFVPHSIAGSERDIGTHGYDYNIEKAKAYLKKAGFSDKNPPPPITLTMSGSTTAQKNFFEFHIFLFDFE